MTTNKLFVAGVQQIIKGGLEFHHAHVVLHNDLRAVGLGQLADYAEDFLPRLSVSQRRPAPLAPVLTLPQLDGV